MDFQNPPKDIDRTKPNLIVRDNFSRSHVPDRSGLMGTCNHCGWIRAFHTKSLEDHLVICKEFQGLAADDFRRRKEEELKAKAEANDAFRYHDGQGPSRKRPRGRKSYQEERQEAIERENAAVDDLMSGKETLMQTLRFKHYQPPQQQDDTADGAADTTDPQLRGNGTTKPPRHNSSTEDPMPVPMHADPEYAMLESTLGMVWQALARTGSDEARVHSPLWNLVAAHAPSVVGVPRRGTTAEGGVYQLPGHLGGV